MMSDALFVCPGEFAEHWPDHFHGANGTGPCSNATEPCGYCGETMERVTWPDRAKAGRIARLADHTKHWMTASETELGTTLRCECGTLLA